MLTDLQSFSSTDNLLQRVVKEGVESRVEVNQRLLIDKLLARYSSPFVIFRELIQNSDDAQATSFHLEITCDTTADHLNLQQHSLDNTPSQQEQQHQSNGVFSSIGKFFRNRRGSTKVSPDLKGNASVNHYEPDSSIKTSLSSEEIVFHNSTVIEIRAVNNGQIFTEVDWKRVATIAEGNTNVDAIGQFGVGFFTVFSYSEQPIIKSGKECMAFVWRDEKSLTTFRQQLPVEEQSSTTSIILKMRNKYILQTNNITDIEFSFIDENQSTEKTKNGTANNIEPKINLNQLKTYFIKVLSFTKHITELSIIINDTIIFQVNKTKKIIPSSQTTLTFKKSPLPINNDEILKLNSSVHSEQTFQIAHGPSITLNHIDVEAIVNIDQNLHNKIRQTLQKSLPPTIHIQLLFPNINNFNKQQLLSSTNIDVNTRILNSLIPLKIHNDEILPDGHIFIGLATHQTTGIGMHVYSQFIPTIERVNLDLEEPYIKIWNKDILRSVGKIIRLIYDEMINVKLENYNRILALYSFQSTVPNTEISSLLSNGFFSSKKNILVPVKRTPSDRQFSLTSSREAFITYSTYIPLFLSIPFVPFDYETKLFFSILKQNQLIQEISYATIVNELYKAILLSTELIALLNWLCSGEISNKEHVKQILYTIRFRETIQSPVITLLKLEFYDLSNISSHIPLPSNVLPANIATHLSCDHLQKKLFLSEITFNNLLNFYFDINQQKLFCNINTSTYLLNFISQYWDRMDIPTRNQIKTVLSTLKCIPTTQGMKLPHDSYVRSANLSSNLPFITLNILKNSIEDDNDKDECDKISLNEQLDNVVSIELLKWIGCRTIQVPESNNTKKNRSNESEDNELFIQDLLKKRKTMSEADISALKLSKCLIGTTLGSTSKKEKKFSPNELHFPSVAIQMNWSSLLILAWSDLDANSPEYAFLKEIGVREIPDLSILIDRIIEEHNDNERQQPNRTVIEYKLPSSLTFLVSNFHQHYKKQWNFTTFETAFLPCYYLTTVFNQNIDKNDIKAELVAPSEAFTDENPLFAVPIPEVLKLFANHCDISLIGVKQSPTLLTAFNKLMKRKNQILTAHSASKIFSYLNKLDGLNNDAINKINQHAFIPSLNEDVFFRPYEVFIRSQKSDGTHFIDRMDTTGLIDFVDYGLDANRFLCNVGVFSYPLPKILAELLLDRQDKYFSDLKDKNNEILSNKLRVYTACLEHLAAFSACTNQLNVEPLKTRLCNERWCLGYRKIVEKNGTEEIRFKIVKPKDVYLNDNQQYVNDLKPLCAPYERNIPKFYHQYGSKWISESVQRTLIQKGKLSITARSQQLQELIQHRFNMLFVNDREEQINNINEKCMEILRNNLSVRESEEIQCRLTLEKNTIILKSTECSTCALEYQQNKAQMYIRNDMPNIDYFDIASELVRFVLNVHDRNIIFAISNKLSSTLESLKRQGIPVDRLLKTTNKQQQQEAVQEQQEAVQEQQEAVQEQQQTAQKQPQAAQKQSQAAQKQQQTTQKQQQAAQKQQQTAQKQPQAAQKQQQAVAKQQQTAPKQQKTVKEQQQTVQEQQQVVLAQQQAAQEQQQQTVQEQQQTAQKQQQGAQKQTVQEQQQVVLAQQQAAQEQQQAAQEQQQPVQEQQEQQVSSELLQKHPIQENNDNEHQTSHSTNSDSKIPNIQTRVQHDRIPDFGKNKSENDDRLSTITQKSKPYTQSKLSNSEYVQCEIKMSCETVPAIDMTRYKDHFHSIPLYVEKNVIITTKMIDQAKQFAFLLNSLTIHVFKMPINTIHLFRDIDGNAIAFNQGGALFFNLRYFEQVFADELYPFLATSSNPFLPQIVNFYFIVICHELSHNMHSGHNEDFIDTMQRLVVKYMPEKELLFSQFSFQNYASKHK